MALQVWLPLDGDLRNQGINGSVQIQNNGAIINNNGKIGKCYSFNGTDNYIQLNNYDMSNWPEYSIACWIKPLANFNNLFLVRANTNHQIRISSSGLSFRDINNSTIRTVALGQNINTNEWTHLCCIYKQGEVFFYQNGIQTAHNTTYYNPNSYTNNNCTEIRIGRSQSSSSDGYFNGLINDFRIYNHALSYKEVSELAKGLILHYRLSKPLPNLLSKYVSPGQANPGVTTAAGRTNYLEDYGIQIPATDNADTYFRLFLIKQLTQNNKYTFSCFVSGLKEGSYYSFPFFAQNNTAMGVIKLDHNGLNSCTFTMNNSAQNAITDPEGKTVYIMFMDDSGRNIASGQQPFQITQMKLEEGDKVTGWIPNEFDSLYSTMGYNSNIELDCAPAGNQNDGTIVGTITTAADSPRYETCAYIQSSNPTTNNNTGLSYIEANCALTTPTAMTVAWWAKPLSGYGGSTNHAAWCTSAETQPTDYNSTAFHHRDARFDICPNSSSTTSINLTFNQYTANEWHHYVVVYDGLKAIAYKDAVQISSVTVGSSITPLKSFNKIFIGFSKAGGVWRKTDGYYSDFRVYCTALSAEDVKELYNTAAQIDKDGNVYAYEFKEA